jgi:hypothetical protein
MNKALLKNNNALMLRIQLKKMTRRRSDLMTRFLIRRALLHPGKQINRENHTSLRNMYVLNKMSRSKE